MSTPFYVRGIRDEQESELAIGNHPYRFTENNLLFRSYSLSVLSQQFVGECGDWSIDSGYGLADDSFAFPPAAIEVKSALFFHPGHGCLPMLLLAASNAFDVEISFKIHCSRTIREQDIDSCATCVV